MDERKGMGSTPRLRRISRRRFLGAAALGSGAAALSAVGLSLIGRHGRARALAIDDAPVRNPAFREAPARDAGHVVVYCQDAKGGHLAYDLNAPGQAIWRQCRAHDADPTAPTKTVAQISDALGRTDVEDVREFVALMRDNALVYVEPGPSRAYFEYEAPH